MIWGCSLVRAEVARPRYRFFAGCLAKLKLPHIEHSVRSMLSILGIEVEDEPDFTCCPDPVVFRSASRSEWLSLAARNLALGSKNPIVTLCPGCASSLSEARHLLSGDRGLAASVGSKLQRMGMSLATPEVFHFLQLLTEDGMMESIGRRVGAALKGMRYACHYGCHLVRPSSAVRFDDPERPTSLDRLIGLAGGEPIDYADKYLCCGRPSLDEATSSAIVEHKLECMKRAGAQFIVVACPFCFEQFDLGQVLLARKSKKQYDLPVLYVTQVLALAMGVPRSDLGFDSHRVLLKEVY
jgi:heterodisulfide reductase subunit B